MRRRTGFSLLELTLALAVTALLALGGYGLISRLSSTRESTEADLVATQELELLLTTVADHWKYRVAPDGVGVSFTAPVSAGVGGNCRDLTITQRTPALALRTIRIQTTCAAGDFNNPLGVLPVPGSQCAPNQRSQVRVDTLNAAGGVVASLLYPRGFGGARSTGICFEVQGGAPFNISVVAGSLVGTGNNLHAVNSRRILVSNDRAPGVEFTR